MTTHVATVSGLLAACETHGIRLSLADDGRLSVDAPRNALTPDILDRLKAHKAELLATLRPGTEADRPIPIDLTHPLAKFDWDASNGYCPGQPIIRNGVRHKRDDCASRKSWLHVWGERYCSDCWPCTDPLALVGE